MENLKKLREEKGWRQDALALKLNISQSTVSFYETGERVPDVELAAKIADLFHVSVDYLLGRSEIRKPVELNKLTPLENNIVAQLQRLDTARQNQVEAFIQGMLV